MQRPASGVAWADTYDTDEEQGEASVETPIRQSGCEGSQGQGLTRGGLGETGFCKSGDPEQRKNTLPMPPKNFNVMKHGAWTEKIITDISDGSDEVDDGMSEHQRHGAGVSRQQRKREAKRLRNARAKHHKRQKWKALREEDDEADAGATASNQPIHKEYGRKGRRREQLRQRKVDREYAARHAEPQAREGLPLADTGEPRQETYRDDGGYNDRCPYHWQIDDRRMGFNWGAIHASPGAERHILRKQQRYMLQDLLNQDPNDLL